MTNIFSAFCLPNILLNILHMWLPQFSKQRSVVSITDILLPQRRKYIDANTCQVAELVLSYSKSRRLNAYSLFTKPLKKLELSK